MKLSQFKDRRVAILGYGREGRAAHALLRQRFPDQPVAIFTGHDPLTGAASGVDSFHAGLPGTNRWEDFDVAIRSPGISPYCPELEQARNRGVAITSGTAIWFAEHPNAFTVAITGTKGKSTTAALTAHLLRRFDKRVVLAGNIGVPLLELMHPTPAPELWVIELSSYQIYGLNAAPSIAVALNLFPEHLDWHGDESRYYADKLSLFKGLGERPAIVNHADENLRARLTDLQHPIYYNSADAIHVNENVVWDGERRLFGLETFGLPGKHNQSNLCAALSVLKCLDLDPVQAADDLVSFQALAHRLQTLGSRDGVEYVDDSISTTPRSAIAAVDCYPGRALTLLAGGHDRGQDWTELARYAKNRPIETVVAFGAVGARIAHAMETEGVTEHGKVCVIRAENLADAVKRAQTSTPAGGVVLLSPGAPSFDEFKDYTARGEAFARWAFAES